jgi:Arc/MetJ-type ribon-helix-helix transcriptional regulator
MMKRITISLDDDLEKFLNEKSSEYGNRSKVVREALKRMKKAEMIGDVRAYFREESHSEDTEFDEEEQIEAWANLSDY